VNEFADESVKVDYFQVELEPATTEAGERCVHASGWGELAAEGGELQQALDAQVVAQGLVGSDEQGLDLIAGGGRGLDGAIACDRQRP
jgi:hypothetical protein